MSIAIHLQDVDLTYRPPGRLKVPSRPALSDVSVQVPAGGVVGVIGANGAGKSTLLRVMAGVLRPDRGTVTVTGRVATLLALGVGFDKRLTGRENILLGGLAAGLTPREARSRIDATVTFAELEEHIDRPLATYSSGMQARLAFSVATQIDPDILLIDEVLGAGDAAFRVKATRRMQEVCEGAGTIVLVSHSPSMIREVATECVWLHRGRLIGHGETADVLDRYDLFAESLAATTRLRDELAQ